MIENSVRESADESRFEVRVEIRDPDSGDGAFFVDPSDHATAAPNDPPAHSVGFPVFMVADESQSAFLIEQSGESVQNALFKVAFDESVVVEDQFGLSVQPIALVIADQQTKAVAERLDAAFAFAEPVLKMH